MEKWEAHLPGRDVPINPWETDAPGWLEELPTAVWLGSLAEGFKEKPACKIKGLVNDCTDVSDIRDGSSKLWLRSFPVTTGKG